MTQTSSPRAAIVTGASRGIGREIALRLAGDGFHVVINYAGNAQKADEVVEQIQSAQGAGRAVAVQADVADPGQVERLFDEAERAFGGVDVLVNNAGINTPSAIPVGETDDELYDRVFGINTRGTFLTLRQAARRLRDGGRIVNFSTSAVGLALPGYAVYAGSKAAVETMTNIMAKELRGRNITVNCVAPGPTGTDLFFQGKSEELVQKFSQQSPLERLGTPQDIANAVAFLVGPEGGWVNGQTLRVNGGIV